MSTAHDPFWQQIVEDMRPRPRELSEAEIALAAQTPDYLAAPSVSALVTRALAEVAPKRRPQRVLQKATAALLLVGFLSSAAWIGARVIWPTPTTTPNSLAHAIAAIANSALPELTRKNATARVDDYGYPAVFALKTWSADRDLGGHVQARRQQLKQLLAGAEYDGALPATDDVSALIAQLQVTTLPSLDRRQAIDRLHSIAAAAIVAMRDARLAQSGEALRLKMLARLHGALD